MDGQFHSYWLANGVGIHVHPARQFKTILIKVFLHQDLTPEWVTQTAVLPFLLKRGCHGFPTARDVMIRTEDLYGARLRADVIKQGERHLPFFQLEVANDRYLPGGGVFEDALDTLRRLLFEPVTEGIGFRPDYLRQQVDASRRLIEAMINDKAQYAVTRCVEEMCRDEKFRLYRYGRVDDLPGLEPDSLYTYYRKLVAANPIDLFVSGDVDPGQVLRAVEAQFGSVPRGGGVQLEATEVRTAPGRAREVLEEQPVQQGKLTMGFRTATTIADDDFPALLFYNGILGNYPHSKLFQNVREKAGLAYYASSRLEPVKGLLIVASGIEFANYERAVEIINQQVRDLAAGEITEYEFSATRKSLLNTLRATADDQPAVIDAYLETVVGGRPEPLARRIERVEAVTSDDVIRVAGKVSLDTVYFLRAPAGGGRS